MLQYCGTFRISTRRIPVQTSAFHSFRRRSQHMAGIRTRLASFAVAFGRLHKRYERQWIAKIRECVRGRQPLCDHAEKAIPIRGPCLVFAVFRLNIQSHACRNVEVQYSYRARDAIFLICRPVAAGWWSKVEKINHVHLAHYLTTGGSCRLFTAFSARVGTRTFSSLRLSGSFCGWLSHLSHNARNSHFSCANDVGFG